ncbi:MAG TPA: ABC transporter permease [Actinomycetota bacterium]|nr:ABC transporter permease [Actinomycetota bacterium]
MATPAVSHPVVRTSEPTRLGLRVRLRDLWAWRELLGNLIRREIKAKYKTSVLGAAWSMLNPMLYLAVFTLVFSVLLNRGMPNFPVYLLSGLLAWGLFSSSVSQAARSVVDNSSLVTKAYFPSEVLPLATIGSTMFDLALQALVLAAFMVIFRVGVLGWNLLLLPLSLFALLTFTAAVALFVAAANVRYRDVQHLLAIALLAWFWMTPIVYQSGFVYTTLAQRDLLGVSLYQLYLANPMAVIVEGFHRALYGAVAPGGELVLLPVSVSWLALIIGAVAVGSLVLLLLTWSFFFRRSGDFAEEL